MPKTIIDVFNAAQQLYISILNAQGPGTWRIAQEVSVGPDNASVSTDTLNDGKLYYTPPRVQLSHANAQGVPLEFLTVLPAALSGELVDSAGNPGALTITAPSLIIQGNDPAYHCVWTAADGITGPIYPSIWGLYPPNNVIAYIEDSLGNLVFHIVFLGVAGYSPAPTEPPRGEPPRR